MTMMTHTRMLSALALTAATMVAVSSDALAKGGFGGMRSFSAVRTSPVVISRARTTTVSTHKTYSATGQTKLKNFQAGDKLKNKQVVEKLKNKQTEDKLKNAKLSPHAVPCNSPFMNCNGPGGG